METEFERSAGEGESVCRYAICDADFCDALYHRLQPLDAALRERPRMAVEPPATGGTAPVAQLRQIYHFDPMKLLAIFDRVSLHHDYVLEFLLHRPTPAAPPEALVYVKKRFVSAFIRNAQQFDMLFGDSRCALHHVRFEHSAEGVLQYILLWFQLNNLFRPLDGQPAGQLALYAEAQKAELDARFAYALDAAQVARLHAIDLRPRVALGETSATVQLHSFDLQHGIEEREFRVTRAGQVSLLGAEAVIAPATRM